MSGMFNQVLPCGRELHITLNCVSFVLTIYAFVANCSPCNPLGEESGLKHSVGFAVLVHAQ